MRLAGKTAVVTGASGGLGGATALAFAREGADVVVHYGRTREAAERVLGEVRALGRRGAALQADVSDRLQIERLVRESRRELGRIDVWMNVAGADILTGKGACVDDVEKLERVIAVDLRGSVLCSWAVADVMIEQGSGSIINISWNHHVGGIATKVAEAFSATKGGVEAFSKNLALRVAPSVRVNVIAPGWIETSYGEGLDRKQYERVVSSIPLRRWGTPEEIAGVAVFLASEEASYLTGQTIRVDGGTMVW